MRLSNSATRSIRGTRDTTVLAPELTASTSSGLLSVSKCIGVDGRTKLKLANKYGGITVVCAHTDCMIGVVLPCL